MRQAYSQFRIPNSQFPMGSFRVTVAAVLRERLERVRDRLARACQRAGRVPSEVTLVGVTKGVPAESLREAIALGLRDLGENRVQEARAKQRVLGWGLGVQGKGPEPRTLNPERPVRWHMIGHLQRNKAKLAVGLFEVVHSVDSLALAKELGGWTQRAGRTLDLFIQVNVSGEATKFGCRPEDACGIAQAIRGMPALRWNGLMTIAPFDDDPNRARPHFAALRTLRDRLATACSLQPRALSLSMGMSHDFEVAVEEGATMVRIGTAIFGSRH